MGKSPRNIQPSSDGDAVLPQQLLSDLRILIEQGRSRAAQAVNRELIAISRKPEELARQELEALREEDRMTPDLVFRDPYLLNVRHDTWTAFLIQSGGYVGGGT